MLIYNLHQLLPEQIRNHLVPSTPPGQPGKKHQDSILPIQNSSNKTYLHFRIIESKAQLKSYYNRIHHICMCQNFHIDIR